MSLKYTQSMLNLNLLLLRSDYRHFCHIDWPDNRERRFNMNSKPAPIANGIDTWHLSWFKLIILLLGLWAINYCWRGYFPHLEGTFCNENYTDMFWRTSWINSKISIAALISPILQAFLQDIKLKPDFHCQIFNNLLAS